MPEQIDNPYTSPAAGLESGVAVIAIRYVFFSLLWFVSLIRIWLMIADHVTISQRADVVLTIMRVEPRWWI